jgi:transmembrane sensor
MAYEHYQPEDFLTDESFLHYCLGSNAGDVASWENWIKDNPQQEEKVKEAKRLFALIASQVGNQERYKGELNEFKALFAAHTTGDATILPQVRKTFFMRPLMRYAAAAALIIIVTGIWFFTGQPRQEKIASTQQQDAANGGAKSTIMLPDGTRVTFNANSKVEMVAGYNETNRMVTLDGEAFFDVAKNEKIPFKVKCGNVVTTALGTSFMVRYYQHETAIKVSLVTGKVKVQCAPVVPGQLEDIVYLDPGQQIMVSKKASPDLIRKKEFKIEDAIRWQHDELTFRDAKFNEVITKLEDWYGVTIEVKNLPVVSKHFTGEFKNKSLKNILEALSFIHKFEYRIIDQNVQIVFPEK